MHFNNPLPRTGLPQFAEQSSQQSLRESGGTGQLWKKASKTTAQESANTRALQQVNQKIEQLRRRIVGAYLTPQVSGLQKCKIRTLYGSNTNSVSYLKVSPCSNIAAPANVTNSAFFVAKSVPSRMSNTATFYGETFHYAYTDDNHRVSTKDSDNSTESQVMTQPFSINDTIDISSIDYSGVNAPNNGGDIKYIEVNTEREWTVPPV
jgi:hypothetical protein